jgi:TetR/AcrR family transcriptional repressor of mexJK operon
VTRPVKAAARPTEETSDVERRSGGRPTLEAARELRERILDIATDMLLSQGYGATSIEAIAKRAGVSKRTFYHRFDDKPALMAAVVVRVIDSQRPQSYARLQWGVDLETRLIELGGIILHAALSPRVVQLRRLMVAEVERFPELAIAVAKAGGRQEAESLVIGILKNAKPSVKRSEAELHFAAQQFLQMVVTLPQSRALSMGPPMSASELDEWITRTVRFFLRGFEGLQAPPR